MLLIHVSRTLPVGGTNRATDVSSLPQVTTSINADFLSYKKIYSSKRMNIIFLWIPRLVSFAQDLDNLYDRTDVSNPRLTHNNSACMWDMWYVSIPVKKKFTCLQKQRVLPFIYKRQFMLMYVCYLTMCPMLWLSHSVVVSVYLHRWQLCFWNCAIWRVKL